MITAMLLLSGEEALVRMPPHAAAAARFQVRWGTSEGSTCRTLLQVGGGGSAAQNEEETEELAAGEEGGAAEAVAEPAGGGFALREFLLFMGPGLLMAVAFLVSCWCACSCLCSAKRGSGGAGPQLKQRHCAPRSLAGPWQPPGEHPGGGGDRLRPALVVCNHHPRLCESAWLQYEAGVVSVLCESC